MCQRTIKMYIVLTISKDSKKPSFITRTGTVIQAIPDPISTVTSSPCVNSRELYDVFSQYHYLSKEACPTVC
jgi:hypothetical protein